jgi:hypothetical protein
VSGALLISIVTYAGLALVVVGLLSVLWPLKFLRIRTRRAGALVALLGLALLPTGAWWPWPRAHASGLSRIDAIVPEYQFAEFHETRVHARPDAVYRAIRAVTAGEIRTFRTLTWIRRGGGQPKHGGETILAPAWDQPILEVATRAGFVWLADEAPREVVVGSVVCCEPGDRVRTTEQWLTLSRAGVAKAAMNFRIEDAGAGFSRVTTETRVTATDTAARRRFGLYWAFIYPGSSLIRYGWLQAIRRRAEADHFSAGGGAGVGTVSPQSERLPGQRSDCWGWGPSSGTKITSDGRPCDSQLSPNHRKGGQFRQDMARLQLVTPLHSTVLVMNAPQGPLRRVQTRKGDSLRPASEVSLKDLTSPLPSAAVRGVVAAWYRVSTSPNGGFDVQMVTGKST